jgi:prepilin-type N-terminal cleavage/methylation domain-containing protein
MPNCKYQKGFTLIELIIVIVILGVLAVTVAPRFINIGSDARIAAVKSLEQAINSAIKSSQLKCRVDSACYPSIMSTGSYMLKYNDNVDVLMVRERRGALEVIRPQRPLHIGHPGHRNTIEKIVNMSGFRIVYGAHHGEFQLGTVGNCFIDYNSHYANVRAIITGC